MKNYVSIILFFFISTSIFSQRYTVYQGDTVNRVDENNMRQGNWIFFNKFNKTKKNKEGKYLNDNKESVWKTYYPSGNLMSELTYIENRKDGYAKIYYKNGKIAEEGIWKEKKWVGKYKYYFKNGKPAYVWNFNKTGKRTGKQQYFYENGTLRIEGDWNNGKEKGTIKEYYTDGSLKSEKKYNNGVFNASISKDYTRNENTDKKVISSNRVPSNKIIDKVDDKKKLKKGNRRALGLFTGNGFHKLYNINKKIEREGQFLNGKLINGKRFYYNKKGNLIKTLEYTNGKVSKVIKAIK